MCIPGTKLMRCGRISVKGEAEEISVSPSPRSGQKHGKSPNPYSTLGRDKFETVYADLSAKRENIATKTAEPEALVRFAYSNNEWIPIVVRAREEVGNRNGALDVAGCSRLGSLQKKNDEKDGELRRNDEGNDIHKLSNNIYISRFDERNHSLVMSSSRFLKITTFGILGLIAMWMRRAAISAAAAMAILMAVGSVMCIKKFILTRVSYFTTLFTNPRNPKTSQLGRGVEKIAELTDVSKLSRRSPILGLSATTSSSPLRAHVQPIQFSSSASPMTAKQKKIDREDMNHQSKSKKFRKVVSMGNQRTRTPRSQGSDSFCKRCMANDCSVGATVIVITLLCLVFYGRFCAILLTSAWWYLFPMLFEQRKREMKRNNNSRPVDLQSNEYKMKVIMDGFLERKHNS